MLATVESQCADLLRSLAKFYPEAMDATMSSEMSRASKDEKLLQKLMNVFAGTRHAPSADSSTTIFLRVEPP